MAWSVQMNDYPRQNPAYRLTIKPRGRISMRPRFNYGLPRYFVTFSADL